MKNTLLILATFLTSFSFFIPEIEDVLSEENNSEMAKPFVDYSAFGQLVKQVEKHRAERLLSLDDFLNKSKEGNTIILDARSKAMYDLKHIKGAVHLNFADFTQYALDEMLAKYAGKNTQILIYCNNNFTDIGNTIQLNQLEIRDMDRAFMSKSVVPSDVIKEIKIPKSSLSPQGSLPKGNDLTLALNIPTYINLYGYGYKNVFELNELVDVKDTRIEFEGTFDDVN